MTNDISRKTQKQPRKSGIPTGNAGEYFVMGELLRRGFDAQLADRNTKEYDILTGSHDDKVLRKVQVKSVRSQPWYVKTKSYEGVLTDQLTIFVLLGNEAARKPVRYFITKNHEVADHVHCPKKWTANGFVSLKAIAQYEDRWDLVMG